MAAVLEPVSHAGQNSETGWVNRLFTSEKSTANYQELKFTLHRKLLDRIFAPLTCCLNFGVHSTDNSPSSNLPPLLDAGRP
jgi:hypothetical protein